MMNVPAAPEVLAAMITPAVLISASGTLVLSTSNRLSRVVDRVRVLAEQAEQLRQTEIEDSEAKRQLLADQLRVSSSRALLLQSAMTSLYLAIGLLVTTSIAIGVVAVLNWAYGWIPVVLGLLGTVVLLYGSFLLVREARLAVESLMQEMAYAQETVAKEAKE